MRKRKKLLIYESRNKLAYVVHEEGQHPTSGRPFTTRADAEDFIANGPPAAERRPGVTLSFGLSADLSKLGSALSKKL